MLTLTPNRLTVAIERVQAKLDTLPADKVAALDATLAVEADEHFAYQQAQAEAHVSGKLASDEAQIVYAALGEVGSASNGGWTVGTTTATKVVVTQLVGELLAAKIKARRGF